MFSAVNMLLVRNISKIISLNNNYKPCTRLMHQVKRVTSSVNVNNFFKTSLASVQFAIRPIPAVEPKNNSNSNIFDLPFPFSIYPQYNGISDPVPDVEINEPSRENICEKQAARLVVIRRRKMKKHKLRKLRKRMKFEWAKLRQRRELKKEKLFQAKLIAQIKEGEKFDAAEYIAEKLRRVREFNESQQQGQDMHFQKFKTFKHGLSK